MPRPKRTRAASARTVAKENSPVVVAEPEQTQTTEPGSDIYDLSDREKEKSEQKRKSTRAKPAPTSQQAKLLETARQRRDSAMDRLENMTSTSSNREDGPAEESDVSVELGRRVAGTPQHRRMADISGLDLDDDEFDDLNTTFDTADPASAQRSADTSTMSASVFRRRPRAGSFLSRDEGYIRPSSRAGPNTPGLSSAFNIGVFKRRAREPSILGTAQKPRPQRSEPEPELESSEQEDEDEDGEAVDGDGFAPEAESTPSKRSKRRSGEAEADRTSPESSSSANPRKRKSSEGHERRARSALFQGDRPPVEGRMQQSESDLSSLPSSPPRALSRPVTPIMNDELMAPPLSSGSSVGDSDEIWPPLQSLARGRPRRPASALQRTPVLHDNMSDMSSPPSLTYSPNYREPSPVPLKHAAKPRRRAVSKPGTAKVTTAELAGLLPRRRHRNPRAGDDSDAEVDISGLGDDDDELSYLDVRARRHPTRPASRGAGGSKNQNRAAATRGKSNQRGKAKQPQTPSSNPKSRRATITYGRTSDKENQGEEEDGSGRDGEEEEDGAEQGDDTLGPMSDDEDSQDMVGRTGNELKNAARKFQEVDKWQLDYEEMTQSSSPRDAR
ncbi:hypothetical protein AAE478_003818 [Parahypoxylon ruwenzoriense]